MTPARSLYIGCIHVPDWELLNAHEWARRHGLLASIEDDLFEVLPDGLRRLQDVWDNAEISWVLSIRAIAKEEFDAAKSERRDLNLQRIRAEQAAYFVRQEIYRRRRQAKDARKRIKARKEWEAEEAAAKQKAAAEEEARRKLDAIERQEDPNKPDAPHCRVIGRPAPKLGDPFEYPAHYGYSETFRLPYYQEEAEQ